MRSSERPSHRPAVASRFVCWSRYRRAAVRFTGGPAGGTWSGRGADRGREVLGAVAGQIGPVARTVPGQVGPVGGAVAGQVGEVAGPVLGHLCGTDQLRTGR